MLCENPFICVVDDFLSPELCEYIIELASEEVGPASVVKDGVTGEDNTRTNQVTFLLHGRDPLVDSLVSKVADLIKVPKVHAESLQVINYQVGQRYDPLFDTFNADLTGEAVFLEKSGQRLITALIYLADVGAGSVFPN